MGRVNPEAWTVGAFKSRKPSSLNLPLAENQCWRSALFGSLLRDEVQAIAGSDESRAQHSGPHTQGSAVVFGRVRAMVAGA